MKRGVRRMGLNFQELKEARDCPSGFNGSLLCFHVMVGAFF